MKTLIKLTLASILLISATTSCKKYEEGPGFSFKSAKARISREWKIEKWIDGSTGVETTPTTSDEYTIKFDKDGKLTWTNAAGSTSGTWEFGDKNETLITNIFTSSETVTIHRLTSKELWTIDSDKDQTHFTAK